jgi:hypothetical protein
VAYESFAGDANDPVLTAGLLQEEIRSSITARIASPPKPRRARKAWRRARASTALR